MEIKKKVAKFNNLGKSGLKIEFSKKVHHLTLNKQMNIIKIALKGKIGTIKTKKAIKKGKSKKFTIREEEIDC